MFNKVSKKRNEASSVNFVDKSIVVTDQTVVRYNSETDEYEVTLTGYPRGELISMVVYNGTDDVVVDGIFNIAGNVVTFLQASGTDLVGKTAEIKYLSEI